jgi:hypothetical protein
MSTTLRLAVLLFVGAVAVVGAQDWWGGFRRVPARFPTPESFDGSFSFCRVMYESGRWEVGGQGWRTDYPDADINFTIRLSELTKTRISKQASGEPNHLVVRLTDETLFQCPFAIMEDVGSATLSDADVAGLRTYLLKGGFLWVDDFWGTPAWDWWVSELARVLPPAHYPVRDLTADHPVFRAMFEVAKLPQIPSIQFWRTSGGSTSERGSDSKTPTVQGVVDHHGNVIVLMTHNTDISDAWEREGEDPRFFYKFSPDGYAVGINVILYALTH